MLTLAELRENLSYQIEYESLWRSPTDAELNRYINWAYADIATFSMALVALRSYPLEHNANGVLKFPATGSRAYEWDFSATGLMTPFHILWERQIGTNLYRFTLNPSVQKRPDILLQNAERVSRAPSSIDEHPVSAPQLRIFPENRLGSPPMPGSYPAQYYFHNGRFWFYPEPEGINGNYGTLWVYGAFVPVPTPHAVFKPLASDTERVPLPMTLATLIPDVAYYYWARGVTDLYPLAEEKRQRALQLALLIRQQMVQQGIQGAPFTENMLTLEAMQQLGGRTRNAPSRRGRTQSTGE